MLATKTGVMVGVDLFLHATPRRAIQPCRRGGLSTDGHIPSQRRGALLPEKCLDQLGWGLCFVGQERLYLAGFTGQDRDTVPEEDPIGGERRDSFARGDDPSEV